MQRAVESSSPHSGGSHWRCAPIATLRRPVSHLLTPNTVGSYDCRSQRLMPIGSLCCGISVKSSLNVHHVSPAGLRRTQSPWLCQRSSVEESNQLSLVEVEREL